eukprot:6888868-Alexandrium_andersonii.AAC.1
MDNLGESPGASPENLGEAQREPREPPAEYQRGARTLGGAGRCLKNLRQRRCADPRRGPKMPREPPN